MELVEGAFAVQLARQSIEDWVLKGQRVVLKELPPVFKEHSGAFVTIHSHPDGKLRGCIGYIEASLPLAVAIVSAGVHVCADPRFSHLREEELGKIRVEVSILTKPELIEVKDPKAEYPKEIVIGRDGLIIQRGVFKGILLPQVAVENSLSPKDFLTETCLKAGLPPTAWTEPKTKVYKFQSLIFEETEPRGDVVEKKLKIRREY